MWKDLTMGQKSEVMRLAVQQGFSDLNNIREMYDTATSVYNTSSNNTYDNVPYSPSPKDVRYADGGYLDWKNRIKAYKGLDIDNDNAYDYEGFYNSNPSRAYDMLKEHPKAHFTDEFKTAYHPTFSTQSKYSGLYHPVYNPYALMGGTWENNDKTYRPALTPFTSTYQRENYLRPEGYLRELTPTEYSTSIPMITVTPNGTYYAEGGPLGNIYQGRGNKSQKIFRSSNSMRKKISDWEGESMYKPAPDTGKVNNPFEVEEAGFWSAIPSDIKPFLTQDMLDALFSTSYNIGSGNFKRRVVPELRKLFIEGTGSVEDVKKSMYGTRDKEPGMKGLRTRRAAERQMFEDAFNAKYPKGFTLDRVPYKTTKVNSNVKWDGKKSIQENLESLGVKFISTSGYRSPKQQSKFKTPASKSWHTHLDEHGNSRAIDIVPAKGMTFDDLRAQLMSPEVQAAFMTYGLGVLDETSTAMKKKTGATGNHFHIGPDKSAVANYAKWLALTPTINQDSPIYHHPVQDMAWTLPVYSTSPTESIAPAIMETPTRPMIVDALAEDTTPTINFDKMWASIFPQVEEPTPTVITPYEQFMTLQSRPRHAVESTPVIVPPTPTVDNSYLLFEPMGVLG